MKHKLIFPILMGLIASIITIVTCKLIAEKLFFDKIIYQKSIKYGYWPQSRRHTTLAEFGKRSQDIAPIIDDRYLVNINKDTFNIAIFGDSFVWGQGILEKQRFSQLLQKQLSKIRTTRVYSFGNSGDNFFDNLIKYRLSQKVYGEMDLYIVGVTDNDLIYNPDFFYNGQTSKLIKSFSECSYPKISSSPFSNLSTQEYENLIIASINPYSHNFCAFLKAKDMFPPERTIFVDLTSLINSNYSRLQFSKMISTRLDPLVSFKINNFYPHTHEQMHVSQQETGHPSSVANQIYANTLYSEIINHRAWLSH